MKERPILFSGEMVRAILEGRKTMTRRIVKFKCFPNHDFQYCHDHPKGGWQFSDNPGYKEVGSLGKQCHYGQPGDRLWVRETWRSHAPRNKTVAVNYKADDQVRFLEPSTKEYYSESGSSEGILSGKWKSSIHMPRWASRITLEIVNVRVERLNDISEEDAKAEGVERLVKIDERPGEARASGVDGSFKNGFEFVWSVIHGPGSWEKNPWVWRIEFRRVA